MPSYFNTDSSWHRIPSGHQNIGMSVHFTPVDASQYRGGQQDQDQSSPPSSTPHWFVGHEHDTISGTILPPPGHTYDNSGFRCPRCGHPFVSQAVLDHHSFICGATALLTGMFTPYSMQQNGQHQPQLHLPATHGTDSYDQIRCQNHIAMPDQTIPITRVSREV